LPDEPDFALWARDAKDPRDAAWERRAPARRRGSGPGTAWERRAPARRRGYTGSWPNTAGRKAQNGFCLGTPSISSAMGVYWQLTDYRRTEGTEWVLPGNAEPQLGDGVYW